MFAPPLLVLLAAVALLLFAVAALGLRLGVRQPDGRGAQVGRLFAGGASASSGALA